MVNAKKKKINMQNLILFSSIAGCMGNLKRNPETFNSVIPTMTLILFDERYMAVKA